MDQTSDLWWEARKKTASMSKGNITEQLIKTVTMSLPNRPTIQTFSTPDRGKSGLVVDLNKYRPDRDLRKFIDAGVDAFALRIGGPKYWEMNNWQYEEDKTFRPYMDQLNKLGYLQRSIGYVINNPFEIWKTTQHPIVDSINQWTSRGYLPHHLVLDHEVSTCWQNGIVIKQSPYNVVGSMGAVSQAMVEAFKKKVSIYTALWFLSENGPYEHSVYFDNINRPEIGTNRYAWLAWYPQSFNREYPDFQTVLNELKEPSSSQFVKYLQIGSYTPADLWQFYDRLKLPGDPTGVDINVTIKNLDEWLIDFGLKTGSIVLPPPPPDPKPLTFTGRLGVVKTTTLNVRENPGTSYRSWFTIPYGTKVEIMEEKLVSNSLWYRIGTKSWICAYTSPSKPRLVEVIML